MIDSERQYVPEMDHPQDECGLFAIYLPPSLANTQIVEPILRGLLQNQHRGEESAGVCTADGAQVSLPMVRMGRINELYTDYQEYKHAHGGSYGHIGIAHTRYSTTGASTIENASPFRKQIENDHPYKSVLGEEACSVAHNGNITNALELKAELLSSGIVFQSTTDSEVIAALIVHSPGNSWEEKITAALSRLKGSFCLLIMTRDTLFVARDRYGIRPLSIATFHEQGKLCYAVSSETSGFSTLPVDHVIDVPRGSLLQIDANGYQEHHILPKADEAFCSLEVTYLQRPDSFIDGVQLDTVRRNLGAQLARLHPVPLTTNLITYIPESARSAAEGFARATASLQQRQIFCETTMIKGRYGGFGEAFRGFMNSQPANRESVAKANYFPYQTVDGLSIGVIDDSIIQGTTTQGVIKLYRQGTVLLKDAGAKQVHVRIVYPQVIGPCPYGTDIGEKRFLVAKELQNNLEEIARYIGADTLEFLTIDEFQGSVDASLHHHKGLCKGCISNVYPEAWRGTHETSKTVFEAHAS